MVFGRVRVWLGACVAGLLAVVSAVAPAAAACPPDTLGVSRTIAVDASPGLLIGSMQYRTPLPLGEREVVLTFDDGPLVGPTRQVLAALAQECVRATFFMVGRMALAFPDVVREVHAAGHTVATHSHSHPYRMKTIDPDLARADIERGFEDIAAVLPPGAEPAPFFRYPGLSRTDEIDAWLVSRGIAVFSADIVGDDWQEISGRAVLQRVLRRLERRGRGIILLHDIKPKTAAILPELLRELKARDYRIVHMVPKGGDIRIALRGTIDAQ